MCATFGGRVAGYIIGHTETAREQLADWYSTRVQVLGDRAGTLLGKLEALRRSFGAISVAVDVDAKLRMFRQHPRGVIEDPIVLIAKRGLSLSEVNVAEHDSSMQRRC